jgi:hypothetical protein
MLPRVRDKDWCIFHPDVVGTRQDRIVLAEDQSKMGGDRYTLKKYHASKIYSPDDGWEHDEILLLSLEYGHPHIRLEENGAYRICGWFVGSVPEIGRIECPEYLDFAEES